MTLHESEDRGSDSFEVKADLANARQMLYTVLSRVYREELSRDFLSSLRGPEFRDLFAIFRSDPLVDIEACREEQAEEELAIEYARLFLGPGAHVSPHESVHSRPGGGLNGPETAEARRFLEAAGFVCGEKFVGLPDHISVELEFLAHLAAQESAAWANGSVELGENARSWQCRFMIDHPGKWIDEFADRVADKDPHSFYGEFTTLLRGFISWERDSLSEDA